MSTVLTEDEVLVKITEYVRREFLGELDGDEASELEPSTPLLQLGILNSQNTGRLLAYVLEQFGISVPPPRITGKHFQDLGSIAAMVAELQVA